MARRRRKPVSLVDELLYRLFALIITGYFVWTLIQFDPFSNPDGQYTGMLIYWGIPLALLTVGVVLLTLWRKRREHQRLLKIRNWQTMSPTQFEKFVAAIFEERGFKPKVVGGAGDDGIDIELFKDNKLRAVVQVKQYNERHTVKPREVRDFLGAITLRNAPGGFFATASDFTQAAAKYGKHPRLKLINGAQLAQMQATIERQKQAAARR